MKRDLLIILKIKWGNETFYCIFKNLKKNFKYPK